MTFKDTYQSPDFHVIEMNIEGLLCSSAGNETVGEEEGNGYFN